MARSSSADRALPDGAAGELALDRAAGELALDRAAGELALDRAAGELLLDVADRSIRAGLAGDPPPRPAPTEVPPPLGRPAATFVTLHVGEELNGCIGSIEATEPLVRSVARHARSAAFDDPRLPPLSAADYARLSIEISVLSPLTPVAASRRPQLLDALRPGVDGLVIDAGGRRAVFLPSVWATLVTPARFVWELFAKARLDPDYWGAEVRAWTFTVEKISGVGRGGGPATVR